ncbi:MAG: hypothetical protein IKU25_00855 [Clostridia bacterium]|nr:hypothetical protein [Clostridia bacterium]
MKCMNKIASLIMALVLVLSLVPFGAVADSVAVTDVTYTVEDGTIYFKVTTLDGYSRVKVTTADNPSGSLAVGSTFTDNGDGTFTWTVKLAAPETETAYLFDARSTANNKYTKTYYALTFVPQVEEHTVKSVESAVDEGSVYFSVVTGAGYDRVKIALAASPSTALAVGTKSVDNGDGTFTWTVKLADPKAQTEYVFDARGAETGKYTKDYFNFTYIPSAEPQKAVTGVTVTEDDGYLFFSVVTGAGYNRVKIALKSAPSTALAVGTTATDNGDGTFTWTVKLADPKAETAYIFDARDAETGKYTKDYFDFTYTPVVAPEKAVKSAESYIEAGMLWFKVVTGAGYNRIKVTTADNLGGSLAVGTSATDNGDGTFTWLVKIADPEKAVNYAFDARNAETGKYTKDYFEYAYTPAQVEAAFKSVSAEFISGNVIVTVVTDNIFNRVKIATTDNPTGYVKYTDSYADNGDGTYTWVLKFASPESETKYLLDGRYTATNRYAREDYEYTLVIEDTTVIKSATVEEIDGKAVFTVVTSAKFNRVKISYASDATGNVKYTNNFVTLENGDRQWVVEIDAPAETTEYCVDARLISTSKYTKEYYNLTFTVEAPTVNPFIDSVITTGAYYANVFVITTHDCESVVITYVENGETKKVTATIDSETMYSRTFVCSVACPSENIDFTAEMCNANGKVLGTATVKYYAGANGGFDHEIIP